MITGTLYSITNQCLPLTTFVVSAAFSNFFSFPWKYPDNHYYVTLYCHLNVGVKDKMITHHPLFYLLNR